MQFKRIFIQFDRVDEEDEDKESNYFYQVVCSQEGEKSKEADLEVEKHLNEGWRIVSTSPVVASEIFIDRTTDASSQLIRPLTFTDGIEVFLVKE